MDGQAIGHLMERLQGLITAAYSEDEFGALMFPFEADFDFAGLSGKLPFGIKVFETVKWAYRFGEAEHVLWLARVASEKRPKRNDLKELVRDIEAAIRPANGPAPAAALPHGLATPATETPAELPADLVNSLGLLETRQFSLEDLVLDLRPKLRAASYRRHDLPGRFHLSESRGHRLTAVLALETEPDPVYFRWLSERVTVETPFVGFIASQAMTAAALRSPARDLGRAREASIDAADRLDDLVEVDDQLTPRYDVAARKRQLQLALSLIDMRVKKGASVIDLGEIDGFLAALARGFDRDGFERLCRDRLQTALKWLANPNDPIELIIVNVVVTARDKSWERDLIRAAYEERSTDPTFVAMYQRYVLGVGAAA